MNNEKLRPFLLVTGMHRSGTSMLMRLCNLVGVSIAEKLVPPLANDNETGFWEPLDVVELNEKVLETLGTSHLGIAPLEAGWEQREEVVALRDRLSEVVRRDFLDASLPGMKDPRFSRLLPMWKVILKQLGFEPHFLIAVRNPVEVARSLEKRNHLTLEEGIALWLQYNQEVEQESRGFLRGFIHYPSLLADWKSTLRDGFARAHLPWIEPDAQTEQEIASFMRPDLRHHAVSDEEMRAIVPPAVAAQYELLRHACEIGEGAFTRVAAPA